ncbi:hypothetical protein EI42_00767 [Thermosporothrix hazakensis]|jgi:hypothetical protein|uniref:Uncharacterized protein n=2 Tax=Thermosporothrix TaxID=768650 RepID=A0A326URN3_THEHA|nr:hypothetical protein [Thermosporothrix hazakensis]PZW36589.1 hypothetical protein EI42_00767 [Thermosporothrix hazakensis]BBH89057.1 hypothetical protein KTC_38080 [Thermosporothrix sp. COM3]GCE47240.1 hypothetical protein KTH_21090 [Thermosporothrix hazakensis]
MRGATRTLAITAGVVVVLLIVGIVLAAVFHVLLEALYIFLMILAALLVLSTLLLVYWIIMLIRTIQTVRNEVTPLADSIQETIGIVKDTAQTAGNTVGSVSSLSRLVSEIILAPGIRIAAGLVAGQHMLRVLLGKGANRSRYEERMQQQMEQIQANAGGD